MQEDTYVFDAYFDDEGNVFYSTNYLVGEFFISNDFFKFVPYTPQYGRLDAYDVNKHMMVPIAYMHHDYPEFEKTMAYYIACFFEFNV